MKPRNKSAHPYEISENDVIVTTGTDSVIDKGKRLHTLAVRKEQRDQFFAHHHRVKKMLLQEPKNPPIEEGGYRSKTDRDHNGELAITTSAMRLLMEKWLADYQATHADGINTVKNCHVVDNDKHALRQVLSNWKSRNDVDIKINFVDHFHHIALYLRREHGKIRCLIIDPEPEAPVSKIIHAVLDVFPDAGITLSQTPLQLDYYSCSVFALHCIKYFVKHGDRVFTHIDSGKFAFDDATKCYLLNPQDLMPEIIKMMQGSVKLPADKLKQKASHKHDLSMREYRKKYSLNNDGRTYNSSAIIKRYRYLQRLEIYLEEKERSRQSHSYIEKISALCAYFDHEKPVLSSEEQSMLDKILVRYPNFATDFTESVKDDKLSQALKQLSKIMFVAAGLEAAGRSQFHSYMEFARTLNSLFDDSALAIKYLHRHVQPGAKLPVHDACIITPPNANAVWDKDYWRKMAIKYGKPVTRLLPLAPQLDKIRNEKLQGKNQNALRNKNELLRLQAYAAEITYKRIGENPELAVLCMRLNKSEQIFEKCLEITKNELKTKSYLPEFRIDGGNIDKKFSGYRMEKLPTGDFRGFFLGDLTNCCQSIGGAANQIAKAGMCSPYADFYVIYNDKDEIVAQMFAYISRDHKIVFDSWEPKVSEYNYLFKPFMMRCVQPIMNAGFTGIRVGMGGRTPKESGFDVAQTPSMPIEINHQYDAFKQIVVCDQQVSQQEKLAKFKSLAELRGLSFEHFQYLLNEDNVADALVRDFDAFTVNEMSMLHELFFTPEFLWRYGFKSFPECTDDEFITKLLKPDFTVAYRRKVRPYFAKMLAEGRVDIHTLEGITNQLIELLEPDEREHEFDGQSFVRVIMSTIISMVFIEDDFKYVHTLRNLVLAILDSLRHGDNGYVTHNDDEKNRILSINNLLLDIISDQQAPADLRNVLFRFLLNFDRNDDTLVERARLCQDVMQLKPLAEKSILPPIILDALQKNDVKFMSRIAELMDAQQITPEALNLENFHFRMAVYDCDANLPVIAIASGSKEAARLMMEKLFTQQQLLDACRYPIGYRTDQPWLTIIGKFVMDEDVEQLKFIRSLINANEDWHKMIVHHGAQPVGNALHLALKNAKYEAAAAMIQGYTDSLHLHALLLAKDKSGQCPLEYYSAELIQQSPEAANHLAALVRKAFANDSKLLNDVIDGHVNQAFSALLQPVKPKRVHTLFDKRSHDNSKSHTPSFRLACFKSSE